MDYHIDSHHRYREWGPPDLVHRHGHCQRRYEDAVKHAWLIILVSLVVGVGIGAGALYLWWLAPLRADYAALSADRDRIGAAVVNDLADLATSRRIADDARQQSAIAGEALSEAERRLGDAQRESVGLASSLGDARHTIDQLLAGAGEVESGVGEIADLARRAHDLVRQAIIGLARGAGGGGQTQGGQ